MLADIEDAMIEAFQARQENGSLGYKYKALKTYGGEFNQGMDRAVVNFPAALFLYEGGPIVKIGQSWKVTARWLLMLAGTNLRNEAAARHGDSAGKVGTYQMIMDALKILANETFGLAITPIVLENVLPLVNDGAGRQLASVYGIRLSTTFITDTLPDVGSLDRFITAHTDWDIPPHGNVDRDIPSDDTADATDLVTLPQ